MFCRNFSLFDTVLQTERTWIKNDKNIKCTKWKPRLDPLGWEDRSDGQRIYFDCALVALHVKKSQKTALVQGTCHTCPGVSLLSNVKNMFSFCIFCPDSAELSGRYFTGVCCWWWAWLRVLKINETCETYSTRFKTNHQKVTEELENSEAHGGACALHEGCLTRSYWESGLARSISEIS